MVIKWKNFKDTLFRKKGLGIITASDVIGNIISSAFWIYLASVISAEDYGEIFYFISIASVAFNLSNIGTQNNMVVLTAKGKNLESTINFVGFSFATVASLILIIIFYQVDVILLLFGYIINTLSLGYLIGKQFYSKYAKYLLLQKILTATLGLLFLYLFGPDGVITALGLSYVGFLFVIIKIHKNIPLNFSKFKENWNFIWQNFSLKFIGALRENIDKILIAPLLGFSFLGNYALSLQIIAIIAIPNGILYKYLLTNDARKIQNKTLKKYYLLAVSALSISCSFLLPTLVPLFFPHFTEIGILQIMSFILIPNAIVGIKFSELLGDEKSKPVLICAILGLVTVTVGVLTLASLFGAYGIAVTYVLTTTSMAIFLLVWTRKHS